MEMNWSRWFRCESSFDLWLVPRQPGIFAVAEEVIQGSSNSSRMLAVLEIEAADDLLHALNGLFAPGSPWRERMSSAACYVRYAVTPDPEERRTAMQALKGWLNSQRDLASTIFEQSLPRLAERERKTIAEEAVDRVMGVSH